MRQLERLGTAEIEALRFKTLLGLTTGFSMVQLSTLVFTYWANVLESFSGGLLIACVLAWISGSGILLFFLHRLITLYQAAHSFERFASILHDEYTREVKLHSYKTGFWALILGIMVVAILLAFGKTDFVFIIHLLLLIGVDAVLIRRLVLLNPTG